MKTCFKCKTEKPLSEFYKHPRMADGHLGKCKDCTKADVADRIAIKSGDLDWVMKELERCRIKQERYRELGLAAKTTSASQRKYYENNRHKKRAENKALRALKSGVILASDRCEDCGKLAEGLEMHHGDYSKPLAVVFLCTKCHGKTRRKTTL